MRRSRDHEPSGVEVHAPGWVTAVCGRCGGTQTLPAEELNRSGMRGRCSGLKRSGLDRGKGLSPVSGTNSGGPETFGPLADYARSLGCAVRHHEEHACQGEVQSHHVRSRGAGHGDRTRAGEGNVVGLCWRAHHEIHTDGMHTFERRYSINLKARAHSIAEEHETAGVRDV